MRFEFSDEAATRLTGESRMKGNSVDELLERLIIELESKAPPAGSNPNTVHLRPLAHARGSVGCCSSEPRTSVSGLSVWWEHLTGWVMFNFFLGAIRL